MEIGFVPRKLEHRLQCGNGYVPLGKSRVTCKGGVWTGEVSDMVCDEAAVLVTGGFSVNPFRMVSTVEVQFANGSKVRLPNHPAPQKKFSVTLVDGSIISCGDGKHYRHGRWDVVEYVGRTSKCWKMTQHYGWQPYKDPIAGDCGHKAVSVFGGLYLAGPGSTSENTPMNEEDNEEYEYNKDNRHNEGNEDDEDEFADEVVTDFAFGKKEIPTMYCSKSRTGRLEMLKPDTQQQWEKQEMAYTSIGRNGCAVKVSGDTFLTLGGKTGPDSYSTVVVAHNIVHQARRNVSVMPHSLSNMGCVYFQKDSERFIILAGGSNVIMSSSKTLALDLNTFTWHTFGDLVQPAIGIELAVMDGTIFAFGGSDEESVGSAKIQNFNWHSKQWGRNRTHDDP